MNVRQVAFLLFASVGLWSISATIDAQQLQIKGPKGNTSELSGSTYGPITPEDTLWRIASKYRQNKNLSVYQVMQAIYQLNPDAFDDQNFNHLIDGSILNLPSEQYAARIDVKQAQLKAEQDDSAWQAFNRGETDKVVVKKVSEVASKDDLTATKQVIEDKLTALDAEQSRQFMAIRQQFAESIESVQTLLTENRKLVDRLDLVDTEISSLRGRVDEELQVQMDQMLALQNELLAISKEAEAQRKAEMENNHFAWLTDPLFLIFLSALLTISLLGALAMWLIRRNRPETPSESILDENHAAVLEQSDEMDDLADALTNELSEELDDGEDDDLFGDDDLLDDVLSDELEESLDSAIDEEFEAFDDLDDESLDPVIEEASDEIEDNAEALDQDELDSLFDEDEDEDLLAEIEDDLDVLETEDVQEDDFELSETDLDASIEEDIADISDLSSDDKEAEIDQLSTDEDDLQETVEETHKSDSVSTISPVDIDDEPDKPEISIDELLESPQQEEDADSVISDNPDLMNEEMLQNIDKEIHQQNEQLDNITDELLNEIEQLEQMGDMLEDDAQEPEITESQMGIQELDSLSEDIDDDVDAEEIPEDSEEDLEISDELFDATDDSEQSSEQVVHSLDENAAAQQPNEAIEEQDAADNEVDLDDIDALLEQQNVENTSVETQSADELLAELEDDIDEQHSDAESELADVEQSPPDSVADESSLEQDIDDTEASLETESEAVEDLDKALAEFEQEVVSEATNFDVELESEDQPQASEQNDDVQLEHIIESEQDSEIEQVIPDLDDDIPSLDDIDSLSESDSDGFDDADLDEALKAFDEGYLNEEESQTENQKSDRQENVELDDLPGLGDWLSSEEADESTSIDELENTSFDELLDSIDDTDDEIQEQEKAKDATDNLDSGLDFDALLNDIDDTPETVETKSEDDFLDVDDLINESIEAEGNLEIDKDLNLAAAFESYKGLGDADEVDVDGDHGIGAKLDLAQAYIETDDIDSAKELLEEVLQKGDESQQEEAKELLEKLS